MAAGVRLCSSWGITLLVCLIVAHFDDGEGLPLLGGQGNHDLGGLELLAEDQGAVSIEQQLAEAERLGSGEVAYKGREKPATVQTMALKAPSKQPRPRRIKSMVGRAAQLDLMTNLVKRTSAKEKQGGDMFSAALDRWDHDKVAVDKSTAENKQLLGLDLQNQVESSLEERTIASVGKPEASPLANPLAESEKKATTGFHLHDDYSNVAAAHKGAPAPDQLASVKMHHEQQKTKQDWMTNALAAWGREEDASLEPSKSSGLLGGEEGKKSELSVGHNDLGESNDIGSVKALPAKKPKTFVMNAKSWNNDLGEADGVDAAAAAAEGSLNKQIEAEAQEAASEVVSSTMASVEKDFLFAEKAITSKLDKGSKKLTLEDLDKAGGKQKRDKMAADAKKQHKEMNQKAQENYELAMANVKKVTQQKLANELVGLKLKLRHAEDKILGKSKIAQRKAREESNAAVRGRTLQLVQKMKATLPSKLSTIKQKAEADAQKVATMAIQQITQGAKKVRMRLTNDLGEAASRVKAAQQKLANSDQNPSMALKAAVDVRTEKAKYAKLHDLAESALGEQKAKSAKKIQEAEENAKESVKLAVRDAEKTELKEAQGALADEQKKVEAEEKKKLDSKLSEIKKMAKAKIKAERVKFKELVDAAVKMAPQKEKDMQMKAKIALHKAKIAADAYQTQMMNAIAPKSSNGKAMTPAMAAECIKNPAGCTDMSLQGGNVAAAAKYAESRARKAARAQKEAKEGVQKAMEKLRVAGTVARKYAQEARAMDDKQTRIKLAELQLNEAKASAAFHSAAKAHLQTQLVHAKMTSEESSADSKMKQFQDALKELKVTHSEALTNEAEVSKSSKAEAFAKARAAAKALLKMKAPA